MALAMAVVEEALLALAPGERAAVIQVGLLSLDDGDVAPGQADVDAAWRDEIASRLSDVLSGTVALGTIEETRAQFAAACPPQ
jgi:hypothetical protein